MMAGEPPIHVALNEAHFRLLVAGKVAEITLPDGRQVRLILSDIGWDRIDAAIGDAKWWAP